MRLKKANTELLGTEEREGEEEEEEEEEASSREVAALLGRGPAKERHMGEADRRPFDIRGVLSREYKGAGGTEYAVWFITDCDGGMEEGDDEGVDVDDDGGGGVRFFAECGRDVELTVVRFLLSKDSGSWVLLSGVEERCLSGSFCSDMIFEDDENTEGEGFVGRDKRKKVERELGR
jgi:hypothetical protein